MPAPSSITASQAPHQPSEVATIQRPQIIAHIGAAILPGAASYGWQPSGSRRPNRGPTATPQGENTQGLSLWAAVVAEAAS
jgi:hypothetical protein